MLPNVQYARLCFGTPGPSAYPRYRPDYWRRQGRPIEVNFRALIRPRHSFVGSLNFESVAPFHGLATDAQSVKRRMDDDICDPETFCQHGKN